MDILSPPLITDPFRSQIQWTFWEVFWADERCAPLLSPDSNFAAANRLLFKHVNIPWEHIHEIDDTRAPGKLPEPIKAQSKKLYSPFPASCPGSILYYWAWGRTDTPPPSSPDI